ncbi:MAG: STAS domain-containing protein [Anaerolineae bacterium]|nr:STAS domain-containing protein [Anaerolineae bacterium]
MEDWPTNNRFDEEARQQVEIEETDPIAETDSGQNPLVDSLTHTPKYFSNPVRFIKSYKLGNVRPDLIAGLTVGVIALPQVIAFALIAELPPEMGLYGAIVAGIVGALWGSSDQMNTGPANAISILVLSSLLAIAEPGSSNFILAAGMLAVMAGVFQLIIGLSGLGMLVNFVSHSVIIGFASGAGLLIGIGQLKNVFGLQFESRTVVDTIINTVLFLPQLHLPTTLLSIGTIILIVAMRKFAPKLPGPLLSMIVASFFVYLLDLTGPDGVRVIGELPRTLPPLADLPLLDLELIAKLSTGALAVGAIGLIQTTAIARAFSTQTGQRLDSNQEFVGQGLANIGAGLFSGYAGAGSFARSAVNMEAGAKTRMSSLFSSVFVLVAMISFGWLGAYLPIAALAGVLMVTAYGLVDTREMRLIWKGNRTDAIIMFVTFFGTIFLQIEFAVLMGVLISFAFYITQTSVPKVFPVVPDKTFKHFIRRKPGQPGCPQLGIIKISGDLYFGAVNHVEELIIQHMNSQPTERFLLLRMHGVNNCDISGIRMLENIHHLYHERGGDIYFMKVQPAVWSVMKSAGFCERVGEDHFLNEEEAISFLFHHTLDPAICIYECPFRAFKECQNLPKSSYPKEFSASPLIPEEDLSALEPKQLWQNLHKGFEKPIVIDVREPREYQKGHVPNARLVPLGKMLAESVNLPKEKDIVLVCRSGRRSGRAASVLKQKGFENVSILQGGILAWEAADLLEAVDLPQQSEPRSKENGSNTNT